jgi:hypothetical protein
VVYQKLSKAADRLSGAPSGEATPAQWQQWRESRDQRMQAVSPGSPLDQVQQAMGIFRLAGAGVHPSVPPPQTEDPLANAKPVASPSK